MALETWLCSWDKGMAPMPATTEGSPYIDAAAAAAATAAAEELSAADEASGDRASLELGTP